MKAFLLDKENLSSIVVEPYYEELLGFIIRLSSDALHSTLPDTLYVRLSESKEKETFEELPLGLIKQKYEGVAGGKAFLEELLRSGLVWEFLFAELQLVTTQALQAHKVTVSFLRPKWEEAPTKR